MFTGERCGYRILDSFQILLPLQTNETGHDVYRSFAFAHAEFELRAYLVSHPLPIGRIHILSFGAVWRIQDGRIASVGNSHKCRGVPSPPG
jgi:hypothetical protein